MKDRLYRAVNKLGNRSRFNDRAFGGVWDPPETFNEDALNVCRCCMEFDQNGVWPSGSQCNWPSVNLDQFCPTTISGTRGYGVFDYVKTDYKKGNTAEDLIYIKGHWGEPFYPASCLTDINCTWVNFDKPWPWGEQSTACCLPNRTCAEATPLVCDLHGGNSVYSGGSCETGNPCGLPKF